MHGMRVWYCGLIGYVLVLLVTAVGVPRAGGETIDGSLSGFVYDDINNSGTYDDGEDKISDVLIILGKLIDPIYPADPGAYSLEAQTLTDSQGFYQFDNILPGTYSLTEITPEIYVEGIANAVGSLGGYAFDGSHFTQIGVCAGDEGIGYNFGEWGFTTEYLSKRSLTVVPEPSMAAFVAAGVFFCGLFWRRRR